MAAYLGAAIGFLIVLVGLAYGFGLLSPSPPSKPAAKPASKGGKPPAAEAKKGAPAKDAPRDGAAKPAAKEASKPAAKAAPKPAVKDEEDTARNAPGMQHLLEEGDDDVTIVTLAPRFDLMAEGAAAGAQVKLGTKAKGDEKPKSDAKPKAEAKADAKPKAEPKPMKPSPAVIEAAWPQADDHEEDDEQPKAEEAIAVPIFYDPDASVDEPTRVSALILVSAASQTDRGRRRKRNEDSFIALEEHHLFVVADGMGGHSGGEVASKMAVDAIAEVFNSGVFPGEPYPDVPRRGSELALAIQMANKSVYEHSKAHAELAGMGTTVVGARFSPNKQRVYIGHVGDSRAYRLRNKELVQLTTDHTLGSSGVTGPLASHLLRAVGIMPAVKVDLIITRPRPEDVYLLCSDGLTKMVPNEGIQEILLAEPNLDRAVEKLVERANASGGRDNITVILVQVKDPRGLARYVQQKAGWGP